MASLPAGASLQLSAFSQQDTSIVDRSEVERGPAKTRRNATDPMVTDSGTLLFRSRASYAAFRAWLYSAAGANAGAGWFDWTDPRTGTLRSIRFVTLGALTPLAGMFAVAQQAVTFEYLETVETIASLAPRRWDFVSDVEGWTPYGASGPVTWNAGGIMVSANAGQYPIAVSPYGLGLIGALYSTVRMSIQRLAGSGSSDRVVLYAVTGGHPEDSNYLKILPDPGLAIGQSAILEWDMRSLTRGGSDWVASNIEHIRIDFGGNDADAYAIDWIEIGAP